jgi:hypothetical protein
VLEDFDDEVEGAVVQRSCSVVRQGICILPFAPHHGLPQSPNPPTWHRVHGCSRLFTVVHGCSRLSMFTGLTVNLTVKRLIIRKAKTPTG